MSEFIGIDFGNAHCRSGIFRSGRFEIIENYYDHNLIQQGFGLDEYFKKRGLNIPVSLGLKNFMVKISKNTDNQQKVLNTIEKLFHTLNSRTRDQLGSDIINSVVSVPCYYHDRERSALISIAEKAGFNQIRLLDENVALAMGLDLESSSRKILVYSLGAGNFSCTVMSQEGKNFRPLNSEFSDVLSGNYFESVILIKILENLNLLHHQFKHEEQVSLINLAVKAKMELSGKSQTVIQVKVAANPKFGANPVPMIREIPVSRAEFEENSKSFVAETIRLCRSAIQKAGIADEEIDLVLLSGGSTKIPIVGQMIGEAFKAEIKPADHYGITRGLALFASILPEPEVRETKPEAKEDNPEVKEEQPVQTVPPAVQKTTSPEIPKHRQDYASEWVKMFSTDLDEYRSLWQNKEYVPAIDKMEKIRGEINNYIANLCLSAGKIFLEQGLINDAQRILIKGYHYEKTISGLLQALAQCFDIRIREAYDKKNYRATLEYLKEALSYIPEVASWKKLQADLRNNLKKLERQRNRY